MVKYVPFILFHIIHLDGNQLVTSVKQQVLKVDPHLEISAQMKFEIYFNVLLVVYIQQKPDQNWHWTLWFGEQNKVAMSQKSSNTLQIEIVTTFNKKHCIEQFHAICCSYDEILQSKQ